MTLANVDDLHAVVAPPHRRARVAEAPQAEAIVEEEIAEFASLARVAGGHADDRRAAPARRRDRRRRARGERRALRGSLSERDRERVAAVARAVAQRLLHEPTLQVKQADGGARHARMHVLRELFGLLDETARAVAPSASR